MLYRWLWIVGTLLPALVWAQTGRGPYARIAVLRPHDGQTTEFEAGYLRHLAWHQQAGDKWIWYGWSIWAGNRYRWFVYATFGHSAASFDSAVAPAEDERDNVLNVAPHVEWIENGLYEFLPALSRGPAEGGAATDSAARVHDRRVVARDVKGVRGSARSGPGDFARRDALVSNGRWW